MYIYISQQISYIYIYIFVSVYIRFGLLNMLNVLNALISSSVASGWAKTKAETDALGLGASFSVAERLRTSSYRTP